MLGATSAAGNKVLFQSTVRDAQELAPEFAEKPKETASRPTPTLVTSPRPVEDIWDRGHPFGAVMGVQGRYFWLVDWLRRSSNEKYCVFNPNRIDPKHYKENPGKLHWSIF